MKAGQMGFLQSLKASLAWTRSRMQKNVGLDHRAVYELSTHKIERQVGGRDCRPSTDYTRRITG